MKKKEEVVRFEHVGKTYKLGKIGDKTIQGAFKNFFGHNKEDIFVEKNKKKEFKALQDICCTIYEGERVGIIGRNGAGKSTALKLLSRVTAPDKGRILINGRVSSMLEVGTGFHSELTGRENIYMNGAILGMTKKEVDSKIEEIISFSECEEFIDTPVKRYSSGMYVKLAFAVVAFLDADIFLMDEVLAVGDMMFQKKCLQKMKEISENRNKTILYVSHNMQTIRELCDRCVVLDSGRIIHDGAVEEGIRLYMKDILEVKNVYEFEENRIWKLSTGNIRIFRIEMDHPVLGMDENILCMRLYFQSKQQIEALHMRFTIYDSEDTVVGTAVSERFSSKKKELEYITCVFDTELLTEGEYSADIAIVEPHGEKQSRHEFIERAVAFRIEKRVRLYRLSWNGKKWGHIRFSDMTVHQD